MIKSTNELDRFADSVFKNTLHQIKMIRSELKYEYKEFINSPEFINIENQLDTIEDDVYREIKSTKLKIEKNKQKIYKLDKN